MNPDFPTSQTVRPGDDFYHYANDAWLAAHPLPDAKPKYGTTSVLRDAALDTVKAVLDAPATPGETAGVSLLRAFYTAGVDEAGIEAAGLTPVQPLLDQITSLDSVATLTAFLGDTTGRGQSLFWDFDLDLDAKDSSRYLMRLQQAGLGLPDRDFYLVDNERFLTVREAYKTYLIDIFTLFGQADPSAMADATYRIELELARASMPSEDLRDPDRVYHRFTAAELEEYFSAFAWSDYLKRSGLNTAPDINVDQPDFAKRVIELFNTTPISDLRAYITFHALLPYLSKLPKRFVDRNFAFYGTVLSGATELEPRYRRVLNNTYSLLLEPVGQVFIDASFSEAAKTTIQTMVANILNSMGEHIDALDWMSQATKAKAHEKLATFIPLLGYPDTWRSYDDVTASGSYAQIWEALVANEWRYMLNRLTRPVDHHEWIMSPALVNACYWPNANSITFPAAILQPPFFDATGDLASNYGAIGSVIGHEITHGFDDEGSQYDAAGNLHSWWTPEDRAAFDARAKRLVDQFDAYTYGEQHVNGQLTLGENIADLGGALIAIDAMHEHMKTSGDIAADVDGFTPEQRFFLGYAHSWAEHVRPEILSVTLASDPHSPDMLRVNGILPSIDAFYDAFGITAKDALYRAPDARIRIW